MKWTAKYVSFYGRTIYKKKKEADIFFESLKKGHAVFQALGLSMAEVCQNICEHEKARKRLEDYMVEPDCPWPRRPE